MPVVFRKDGLNYYFFSNEGSPREPPHVHVKGRGCDAKIWVLPEISVADSFGFSSAELRRILANVAQNRALILRLWNEHFADGGAL